MDSLGYDWECLVCDQLNAGGHDSCTRCGSPSRMSAAELKEKRGGGRPPASLAHVELLSESFAAGTRFVGYVAIAAGAMASTAAMLLASGGMASLAESAGPSLLSIAWILCPYALPLYALRKAGRTLVLVGGALASIGCAAVTPVYIDQFIHPDAQSALIFLFAPAWQFAVGTTLLALGAAANVVLRLRVTFRKRG